MSFIFEFLFLSSGSLILEQGNNGALPNNKEFVMGVTHHQASFFFCRPGYRLSYYVKHTPFSSFKSRDFCFVLHSNGVDSVLTFI